MTSRILATVATLAVALIGCAVADDRKLTGQVRIAGSSTVFPIMSAAAEMFQETAPRVKLTIAAPTGTGDGFKKLLESDAALRIDICNASRPITPTEQTRAAEIGVRYIELPIAYDGTAVVVHPDNKFCDQLTIEELKRIWEPDSKITNWKDVRAGFPDLKLTLYGPGANSGTFDHFTEVIVGKARASRTDYVASESDNMLVQGVSGDAGALGYFGFAYYESNKAKLRAVPIVGHDGTAVTPSVQSIHDLQYVLARPLFVYVNADSAKRPETQAFVKFLLTNAAKIVGHKRVNYVPLDPDLYQLVRTRWEGGVEGTLYPDSASHAAPLHKVLRGEGHKP